jgi:DNA processing protein
MDHEELRYWLRLQCTEGVGNTTARHLLTAFGLPQSLFSQTESALREVVTERQAKALSRIPEGLALALETTWDWLQADPQRRRIMTLGDAAYPQALLNIEDPPVLLYAIGAPCVWESVVWNTAPCIAVVGSRNPTPQGAANAHQFAKTLAQSGLTVVSGLALGVDGAAHEGALSAASSELATIAVVGTGLDRVYPKAHLGLARRIAEHGVLLSEYPLGTPPTAANFPQRNRIISGLSLGTLVVEAALKSGSLITARLALEQGKDVFAIPGSIHSTQSRGCHALIKQGAKLVECAQDILEELHMVTFSDSGNAGTEKMTEFGSEGCFDEASELLHALGFDPSSLEDLQARTGIDTAQLQAQLMALELQGRVARMPGALFQRVERA